MFEVKVNVQIGVTPEVANLLSAILNRQVAEVKAPEAPAAEPAAAADPAPETPAPKRTRKPKPEAQPEPEAPAAPAPEPEPAAEDTGDMPDSVYYPSEEDVRTAMHKCRERIEGEDYKDKPSDDRHRAVTEVFKKIAESLSGQKKPSALPQEMRQDFIDATRTIVETPGAENTFTYSLK